MNGSEVNKIIPIFIKFLDFEVILCIGLFIKCICGIFSFALIVITVFRVTFKENFLKVLAPAIVNNWAMRNYNHAAVLLATDDFQCSQCLAKTHLGVPKHLVVFFECFECFFYRIKLLLAEVNRCNRSSSNCSCRHNRIPAFFNGFYCAHYSYNVSLEPFFTCRTIWLHFMDT